MAVSRHRASLLAPEIADYIAERTAAPDDVLVRLQVRTAELGRAAGMQIGADQGALLTLLTRLVGATSAVEVGTFTGYSSISIARGLAPGGRLLCCDVSEEFTALARDAWAEAGLTDVIELRIAPAIETLRALPDDPTIDLAFIDADKGGYRGYYDEIVARLRPGGVVLLDNVLWGGAVVDPSNSEADTEAIRAVNAHVARDDRVEVVMLPISDGLTLARKKG
jgi:caffeoyl-CoA O-methyltransferase